MTSIDDMASEIMKGLQEYADLADTEVKKAVRKTATEVRKEISSNAPEDTGAYAKSWTANKVSENSHSLQMTVYSKNRYQLAIGAWSRQAWRWACCRKTAYCSG